MSTVLVTGATGHLGSLVLPRLLLAGHEVRTLSRSPSADPSRDRAPGRAKPFTGDLLNRAGIVEAIEGVDVVVHCASDPHHPESDVVGTTNLIEALKECAPATHLIYISIVGVDALPWSYYRAKRDVELAIETAAPSWTIQRTTQFHSFLDTTLARLARSPLLVLPRGFAFQPVATQEVADLLVTHVHHGPTGRAPDFGGPDVLSATTLARGWLAARRKLRPIVTAPLPGRLSRAFRAGANLCPDGRRGHTTWQEYLATVDANAGAVAATAHFVQDRR